MNLTFLIPTKLESEDRVRNLSTILIYLLTNFDAFVFVKECDYDSKFDTYVSPFLIKKFGKIPENLKYFYEKKTTSFFHKTKILNDLLCESNTEVVCNYDADVLFPKSTISSSYDAIISGKLDAVYPYGCGAYQKAITYPQEVFEKFINSDLDISYLDKYASISSSTIGWCQFIRKSNYINSFMMNENFYSWGPEDCELYYRLNFLGNKVGRINDYVYHLEHCRSNDSWFSNPDWKNNAELWNWIKKQPENSFIEYYKNQDYVKRRNNVSI